MSIPTPTTAVHGDRMKALPETRYRFFALIRDTYRLPTHALVTVVGDKDRYSIRLRAAALRNLVCSSSLEVTQGRPYAASRRAVRAHFGI